MPPSSITNGPRLARFFRPRALTTAITVGLTLLALVGGALVLALDLWPGFLSSRAHRLVSATPLLAIAIGYLLLQTRLRPSAHELLKRALLSLAFIFWSASQLAPATPWAPVADDLAIALFVLDLSLIIWDELHAKTDDATRKKHGSDRGLLELHPCPCCGRSACASSRLD